jgi:hypothetical protein
MHTNHSPSHYLAVLQLRKAWRRVFAPGCENNIKLLQLSYKKAWGRKKLRNPSVFAINWTTPFLSLHFPIVKTEATEADAFSQVGLHEICHQVTTSLLRKCTEWSWYRCQYSWQYYMSSHCVKAPLRLVKDFCSLFLLFYFQVMKLWPVHLEIRAQVDVLRCHEQLDKQQLLFLPANVLCFINAHCSVWKNTKVPCMQNVYLGRKNVEEYWSARVYAVI